jgi:hypothetical protein
MEYDLGQPYPNGLWLLTQKERDTLNALNSLNIHSEPIRLPYKYNPVLPENVEVLRTYVTGSFIELFTKTCEALELRQLFPLNDMSDIDTYVHLLSTCRCNPVGYCIDSIPTAVLETIRDNEFPIHLDCYNLLKKSSQVGVFRFEIICGDVTRVCVAHIEDKVLTGLEYNIDDDDDRDDDDRDDDDDHDCDLGLPYVGPWDEHVNEGCFEKYVAIPLILTVGHMRVHRIRPSSSR